MHSDDGIKPVRDFWKNGTHSAALFSTSPLSLLVSLSSLVLVTASDSGWRPPGFLKANITAKDELQVCQTCKHALITHFPADDNEVTEIIAVFFSSFFWTRLCTLSENGRRTDAGSLWTCSLSKIMQHRQINKGSPNKEQHVSPDASFKISTVAARFSSFIPVLSTVFKEQWNVLYPCARWYNLQHVFEVSYLDLKHLLEVNFYCKPFEMACCDTSVLLYALKKRKHQLHV